MAHVPKIYKIPSLKLRIFAPSELCLNFLKKEKIDSIKLFIKTKRSTCMKLRNHCISMVLQINTCVATQSVLYTEQVLHTMLNKVMLLQYLEISHDSIAKTYLFLWMSTFLFLMPCNYNSVKLHKVHAY